MLPFPLVSNVANAVVIDANLLALLYGSCGRDNDCCAFVRSGSVFDLGNLPFGVGPAAKIQK